MNIVRMKHAERKRVLFVPDIHYPHHDEECMAALMNMIKILRFEVFFYLGDGLDCYACSSFDKDPERINSLQNEVDMMVDHLKEVRSLCPDSAIAYKEGNHEERIQKYLRKHASGLSSLRCLSVPKLLMLDELDVQFYGAKDRLEFAGLVITHGKVVRPKSGYTAHGEMLKRGRSGISGHTHRLGRVWNTDERGTTSWIEAGCLCRLDPEYGGDTALNWQQGIVIGDYYQHRGKERLDLSVVPFIDGSFSYGGRIYSADRVITR